jgi:hypothetical protein
MGAMQTPPKQMSKMQSELLIHCSPTECRGASVDDRLKHLEFAAPNMPLKPLRQLEQVCDTVPHVPRFKDAQYEVLAPVQLTAFRVLAALLTT